MNESVNQSLYEYKCVYWILINEMNDIIQSYYSSTNTGIEDDLWKVLNKDEISNGDEISKLKINNVSPLR